MKDRKRLPVPIVMYRCINDYAKCSPLGHLAFTARQFRAHLEYFRRHGFD